MRFCLGYPHNGEMKHFFHESVTRLMMMEVTGKPESECLLGSTIESGSCHVPFNRNEICRFFINKTEDDFLVMIDTDVEFGHDILTKLANHITMTKVAYWNREGYPHIIAGRVDIGNGLPVFYKRISPGNYLQDPRPFNGLKAFDMVGTGIICISRYCINVLNREANTTHLFTHREEEGKLMSDDFSFCALAATHGFRPFGAWDIKGTHYKSQPIRSMYLESVEEFEVFKRERPSELPKWLVDEYYKPKEETNGTK